MRFLSEPTQREPAPAEPARAEPVPAEVAERAIEWLVDLQAEHVPEALHEEWQRWRAAHPDHERAWQRIEAVNRTLSPAAAPVQRAIAHATLMAPESASRRQVIAALAVVLFGGGAAWLAKDEGRWSERLADHRTRTGERRTVLLADGTRIMLNTASAINIHFSANERRVQLIAGEILVTTAPDSRRFLVETMHGEAEALGTRYTVRVHGASSDVAVFEGAVRLAPLRALQPLPVLQAGQQARFTIDAAGAAAPVQADAAAWVDGLIVARGMALADFLVQLNRYSNWRLSCADDVATLRVSGSYPLADIGKVLAAVAAMLSLRLDQVSRFWGGQSAHLRRP
ncbi:MAG: FecR domain-containing protein [Duganella sp.]